MWRNKQEDLQCLETFINDLETFKSLREVRWEQIDERVQEQNAPGTPAEDWIIPPDEDETLRSLQKDQDYVRLRQSIEKAVLSIKEIAVFLRFNVHHDFDWLNFTNPLLGHEALEDALEMARELKQECQNKWYFFENLVRLM
jgi:hypothetical protein